MEGRQCGRSGGELPVRLAIGTRGSIWVWPWRDKILSLLCAS